MRRLAVAGAALLLLAACSTAPQAGDVVDKDHRSGYYSYVPGCYNSKGIATCQIPIWNEEQWRIRLCADDVCGWARVSESEYGLIEVGQFYDRSGA